MSGEAPKVFVLKLRGGVGDGVYRLALHSVPGRFTVLVEATGARVDYVHAAEEPQVRDVYTYDHQSKQTTKKRVVEAFYQIFTPAEVRADG